MFSSSCAVCALPCPCTASVPQHKGDGYYKDGKYYKDGYEYKPEYKDGYEYYSSTGEDKAGGQRHAQQ